jgi:hypothetical protein
MWQKTGPIQEDAIGPEFDRRIIQRTIGDAFKQINSVD